MKGIDFVDRVNGINCDLVYFINFVCEIISDG
jgi:hypothetical protein